MEVARLAVQTGAWPVIEIDHGVVKVNVKPRELKPVAEYLGAQRRFSHLTQEQINMIQEDIRRSWVNWLELEKNSRLPWY